MNSSTTKNISSITGRKIKKISNDYYLNEDVVALANSLLGKVLCTSIDGKYCSGIITETEAYAGIHDRGSHSFGNRKTERTKTIYALGGITYIYLCYGIHSMFNVVTGPEETPNAVLIRSLFPLEGINHIKENSQQKIFKNKTCMNGPGKVCKAMGLHYSMNGISLQSDSIYIEDHGYTPASEQIIIGPRVGIDYAGEDALLPYRFLFHYE